MAKSVWITVALAAALLLGSLFVKGAFLSILLIWVAVNVLLTSSFRFVLLIGELNFAIAGFVGIGAYAAGSATSIMGLPFFVSLLIGAAAAGGISLVFGFVTLRTKGPYFLLISFAFTEVLRLIYTRIDPIGASSGMFGIFVPDWLSPYYSTLVVAIVMLCLWILYRLEHSDFGKILSAIRYNDDLVQTLGINVHRTKVWCLGVASVMAGIAGALLAHANNVISPGDFGFLLSVYTLAYLKVGGEGHIGGAIVGAVGLTLLAQYALGFGAYEHIFYGGAIVLAVLLLPMGIVGWVQKLWARRA